jgi:hypothetical protein
MARKIGCDTCGVEAWLDPIYGTEPKGWVSLRQARFGEYWPGAETRTFCAPRCLAQYAIELAARFGGTPPPLNEESAAQEVPHGETRVAD